MSDLDELVSRVSRDRRPAVREVTNMCLRYGQISLSSTAIMIRVCICRAY